MSNYFVMEHEHMHDHHMHHLEELATIGAIQDNARWSSWGSPIGLVLFFNGLAFCAILVRYAMLMK